MNNTSLKNGERKSPIRWLNRTVLGIGLASLFEQRVRVGVENQMLIAVCCWEKFNFTERRRHC